MTKNSLHVFSYIDRGQRLLYMYQASRDDIPCTLTFNAPMSLHANQCILSAATLQTPMSEDLKSIGVFDRTSRRNDLLFRFQTIRSVYAKEDEHKMIRFTLPPRPERAVVEGDARLLNELAQECREDQHLIDTVLRKILFLLNRLQDALKNESTHWDDEC